MSAASILVCRGCCCGTTDKLPDVDHDQHLKHLRAATAGVAKVRVVDCLGPCERANVVVIRRGATRRWFGQLNSDDQIEAVAVWLRSSDQQPPELLVASQIDSTGAWVRQGDADAR